MTATVGVLILQHAMGRAAPAGSAYIVYLICAVLTSRWKVRLPGITGTVYGELLLHIMQPSSSWISSRCC
jgi:hypothetical protein